jgi:rod shape-determining protein MreD
MKKFLYYSVTLMGVLWLQILCNHFLGGSWFSINGVLVAVLFFGLSRGPLVGQLMGFAWGLLMDASSLGMMGLHTLIYAVAGYSAGLLRRQLDEAKAWTQAIFSFAGTLIY